MDSKDNILQQFANAVLDSAKQRNLSLRKLAAASGLEYSQVQRITKGKVNPALTTIISLCEGLEVSPAELFNQFK